MFPLKMVIFHSYVKLPEGTLQIRETNGKKGDDNPWNSRIANENHLQWLWGVVINQENYKILTNTAMICPLQLGFTKEMLRFN